MSCSSAHHAFQAFDIPSFPRRELPRKPGTTPPPAKPPADHPVLFMGGFLIAIGLAVIGLWQGLGLLLPH